MIQDADDASASGSRGLALCLTERERHYLLRLARRTLVTYLEDCERPAVDPADLTANLGRIASCFVTLWDGDELRGCVGQRQAEFPLWRAVIEGSIGAGVRDRRFQPVTPGELPRLRIAISVLGPTRPLRVREPDELLRLLVPERDGVILYNDWCCALYLPQVWETFRGEADPCAAFLDSLSRKAGDPGGTLWRRADTSFEVFEAASFGEEQL